MLCHRLRGGSRCRLLGQGGRGNGKRQGGESCESRKKAWQRLTELGCLHKLSCRMTEHVWQEVYRNAVPFCQPRSTSEELFRSLFLHTCAAPWQ
jgi:hypothetical protein